MLRIDVSQSFGAIDPIQWDKLSAPDFPFVHYHFLYSLETTGCLGPRTGWEPRIVTAWEDLALVGALVLFVKSNSYGEFIFDFAWAEAFQHSGAPYYPKLTAAIPFTPVTGPKLLFSTDLRGHRQTKVAQQLIDVALGLATDSLASSVHALFVPPQDLDFYVSSGFFVRHSFQFHWTNLDYHTFAEFLLALRAKRRKEIRRERAQVAAANVTLVRRTGTDLTPALAELFYKFYIGTIDKQNSNDYLTADFFREVFARMGADILVVLALDGSGQPVAGALNFVGKQTLFGRYWGCLAKYRALHFEVCYYQGIEFAIEKKLRRFEAGAQGEHKFPRGFLPCLTFSVHKINHPRLDEPIRQFVLSEKLQIDAAFAHYARHTPYRCDEDDVVTGED